MFTAIISIRILRPSRENESFCVLILLDTRTRKIRNLEVKKIICSWYRSFKIINSFYLFTYTSVSIIYTS